MKAEYDVLTGILLSIYKTETSKGSISNSRCRRLTSSPHHHHHCQDGDRHPASSESGSASKMLVEQHPAQPWKLDTGRLLLPTSQPSSFLQRLRSLVRNPNKI